MESDFYIGGGGGGMAPPPAGETKKVQFVISEPELIEGLKRVKFYFPLVEQLLEQVLPDDVPYLTAYLAAMVAGQDKTGAVVIRAFTPPFTEYYRQLLQMVPQGTQEGFYVIEPAEADLKGEEEIWQEKVQ